MKKILIMICTLSVLVTMLCGCNMAIGVGKLSFKKVHVDTYHYSGCFTVEKWHDNETGIEVKTKEAGSMFLSEGTYFLLDGSKTCPFCENVEG